LKKINELAEKESLTILKFDDLNNRLKKIESKN
jgi:hypothetical protein